MNAGESEEEKIKRKIEKKLAALDKIINKPFTSSEHKLICALDRFNLSEPTHISVVIVHRGHVHILRCVDTLPHYRWSLASSFVHEYDKMNNTNVHETLKLWFKYRGGLMSVVQDHKQITVCSIPSGILAITKK